MPEQQTLDEIGGFSSSTQSSETSAEEPTSRSNQTTPFETSHPDGSPSDDSESLLSQIEEEPPVMEILDVDVTDDATDTDTPRNTRKRIVDAVGNSGRIGGLDADNAVVGDDRTVVWFPDSIDEPMGVSRSEFTPAEAWDVGYTKTSYKIAPVVGFSTDADDRHHLIDAEKIATIASELGIEASTVLDTAHVDCNGRLYPIIFELDDGFLMVEPIANDWGEVASPPSTDA